MTSPATITIEMQRWRIETVQKALRLIASRDYLSKRAKAKIEAEAAELDLDLAALDALDRVPRKP